MRATKALIHLDRLTKNIAAVRRRIGPEPLICIPVKADGYGHGASAIAEAGIHAGASFLAVATVQEGAELREAGIAAPVLLFSCPLPEELDEMIAYKLTPFIPDKEVAAAMGAAAAKAGAALPVHIKIDTGMGRVGCRPEEAAGLALYIASLKALRYEGTATHLAIADSAAQDAIRAAKKQLARFNEALEAIKKTGLDTGIVHAANSGATLLHEDAYFNMVRPGILLYGYPPSEELSALAQTEPVMELVSSIVFIKKVKKGEAVSYGGTWVAPEDRIIGTIPLGYGDGLPRRLSGDFQVLINGKLYPLAGRICMDQCMVDLGPAADVNRWDKVTVFGGSEGAFSAGDIASKLNTIPYEITCNINKRVPRVYTTA
ncbi:MAG: alanine racemase [Treponema sp.]|jgi:alanine racemase|nr:alanine racemase [Treponema sp.]